MDMALKEIDRIMNHKSDDDWANMSADEFNRALILLK
jgi:hypothetical protein